ncbi:MAG: hypothetical protein KAR47_00730, partial [Planctomycetes bacterium]|nr:hypothetical protein [Planctomycetota bacterium]
DFTDHKQIANTIKFDTEEAVATDATDLALTFSVTDTNQNGSEVAVFTAERQMLIERLSDLQTAALDPTAIEPDIICLARFLSQSVSLPQQANPLFVIISNTACYIIYHGQSQNAPSVRSFLLTSAQDKTSVLAREVPLTIASFHPKEDVNSLIIAGNVDSIDYEMLADRTALEIQTVDFAQTVNSNPAAAANCPCDTDLILAYGAALGEITKTKKNDFREDFMPYQGKRMVMQKALRLISIALTVIMLAAGTYFQTQTFIKNQYTARLTEKLTVEYSAAMYGVGPPAKESMASRLNREYRNVKRTQLGLNPGDDDSIPAKITYIFEALNQTPKSVNLKVDRVTISPSTMRIQGSTNNRKSTLDLFESIKKHTRLKKLNETLQNSPGGDAFTVNLEMPRTTQE